MTFFRLRWGIVAAVGLLALLVLATGGAARIKLSAYQRTARKLSIAQLAGQRVVYAYAGLKAPAALVKAIRAGEAGGVVFFSDNIASRAQIRGVIAGLQRASLASPVHTRLLMLTDQEGGEVRRLPGAPVASEKQIGASPNSSIPAASAGRGAGLNLRGVGINVNLAPVLDVFRRPGNFIDEFQRSYSGNPTTVGRLGRAFVSAQQRLGVAATAKHFPGLGAAGQAQNTDLGPVTLHLTLPTLRRVDEAPYRSAIRGGVKLVMTSWAVYPALDSSHPAGLSPAVLQTQLRHRLGFRGVIVTDGIDAGAVTPYGNLARRSVAAAAAGADLVLCSATTAGANSAREGLSVVHALTAALRVKQLSLTAARASAARILALRAHP